MHVKTGGPLGSRYASKDVSTIDALKLYSSHFPSPPTTSRFRTQTWRVVAKVLPTWMSQLHKLASSRLRLSI